MKYYPIFVDLRGKRCLVVGGGEVAERKVEMLVEAGARVTIISPDLTPALREMVKREKKVTNLPRQYRRGDIRGYFLVYGATDDPKVNRFMADEAKEGRVLINVVDRPNLGNFIAPAVVKRGDLVIAVSTAGASPALAKKARQDLERIFGQEYEKALELLGALRKELMRRSQSSSDRQRIFTDLVNSPLLEYVRRGEKGKVEGLLSRIVGGDWHLGDLGISL